MSKSDQISEARNDALFLGRVARFIDRIEGGLSAEDQHEAKSISRVAKFYIENKQDFVKRNT